jgi:hypothetical protein
LGPISARNAFAAYGVLAVLAWFTLDGESRLVAVGVLAVFGVRTYVEILRRKIAEREEAEAALDAVTVPTPASDVSSGNES